jgi:hypothetical protein
MPMKSRAACASVGSVVPWTPLRVKAPSLETLERPVTTKPPSLSVYSFRWANTFVAIIVGYVLAIKVFSHGKMKNRIIKYSLMIGTTLILINTIVYNWPQLKNDTKTFVVGALLLLFFMYSYKI